MSAKRITVKAWACTCERCAHQWTTKTDKLPATCANRACNSIYWNKPRKNKQAERAGKLGGRPKGKRVNETET